VPGAVGAFVDARRRGVQGGAQRGGGECGAAVLAIDHVNLTQPWQTVEAVLLASWAATQHTNRQAATSPTD
jgi:hypothetical protein